MLPDLPRNRVRSWFHARPGGQQIWRVGIAVAGLIVVIFGIAFSTRWPTGGRSPR
jgi:hypothetical protein